MTEITKAFYCSKCKNIPLIEIYPKKKEFQILTTCKCHKELLSVEQFLKDYMKKNFDISKIIYKEWGIKYSEKLKDININNIIEQYQINKEKIENNFFEIKTKIINELNITIKNIESIYEINKNINNKINNIIQILINNYKLNPENDTLKTNIILNTRININNNNLDSLTNQLINYENKIKDYFTYNYIIKPNNINYVYSYNDYSHNKIILEIKNNIILDRSLENKAEFKIYDYKKENSCILYFEDSINNLIVDEGSKYLISIIEPDIIRFFDINDIEEKLKINKTFYEYDPIELLSKYEFKHDNEIFELINIENNEICGTDYKNVLFIYKYNLCQKTSELVNKVHMEVSNLLLIKRKNKKYIICKNNGFLIMLNIPYLSILNEIQIVEYIDFNYNNNILFYYDQINDDELIISYGKKLIILNLSNFQMKLKMDINFNISYIKKLNDNTILVGGKEKIKRFCLNNLEELPEIILFDSLIFDENNYNGISNNVSYINELSEGKIVIICGNYVSLYELYYYKG